MELTVPIQLRSCYIDVRGCWDDFLQNVLALTDSIPIDPPRIQGSNESELIRINDMFVLHPSHLDLLLALCSALQKVLELAAIPIVNAREKAQLS